MFKLFRKLKAIDYVFFVIMCGFIVLQVWLDLKIPKYTSSIVAGLTSGNVVMSQIWREGGYMLACAVSSLICAVIVHFFTANISSRLAFNLRGAVYNKIQSFSLAEIKNFSTASLITRTTNDVTQIQNFLSMGLACIVKAPVMAIWAITEILTTSWQWSLATAIAVGIMIVMILTVVLIALPKFKKIQTLTDGLNRVTRENLTGVRVVRASNAEDYHTEKFEKANAAITKNNLFAFRVMSVMGPGMNIIMSGMSLAIYWIGAYIVETPSDVGNMTAFMGFSMQVVLAFMLLIMIFIMAPRALVSAKRLNEILETKNNITPGHVQGSSVCEKSRVVFDHVSFKYPNADEYVLKDISFTASEGETVAFIGSTGSGKSTLINLIPRLYDVTEGQVFVDGLDVKEYDPEELNKKIGYIPQRGVLFSGNVRSNVNYGDNNADEETITSAISVAQASSFVSKMENGIDSPIAQGGTNVSGGQKQRLSIARAIARNPEIFIFDDSFSALDYKTDKKLRAALKKHTEKATKFIVAQRIGTIKDADQIIVLDNGMMVGHGTHEELLKKCPVYKEIALSQLSKEEL